MTTPATAREIVERLPMFVVACSHCPKPLSHDYGYAEKANLALAIVTQALDAAVRAERERWVALLERRPRGGSDESWFAWWRDVDAALRAPEAS